MKIYARPDGQPFDFNHAEDAWVMVEENGIFTMIHKNGEKVNAGGFHLSHKEIQYPPHWPHAFKYRWEPLSKLFAPSGFVYIGKGNSEHFLKTFVNRQSLFSYYSGTEVFKGNWDGSLERKDYFVTKELWNETFKEFLTEEKEMKNTIRIYTKADSEAWEIVKKMAKARGLGQYHVSNSDRVWILGDTLTKEKVIFDSADVKWSNEEYKEVPLHEFIYQLGQIPEKVREKEINILPWKVVVRGEKCDIGCRKDVSVKSVINWCNSLPGYYGIKTVFEMEVKIGKNGFEADSKFVSWGTLAEFKKELEK